MSEWVQYELLKAENRALRAERDALQDELAWLRDEYARLEQEQLADMFELAELRADAQSRHPSTRGDR